MVISSKLDYASHAMNYIAFEKCPGGCSMNDIYSGETIPREYAEAIMMELTHRGFLTNEDKVNGNFKLARPWDKAASLEMTEIINDLWCWPSLMPTAHKKRGVTKKTNTVRNTASVTPELSTDKISA